MREIVSTEPNAKCWRTPLFVRLIGTDTANTEPNGQIGGFHLWWPILSYIIMSEGNDPRAGLNGSTRRVGSAAAKPRRKMNLQIGNIVKGTVQRKITGVENRLK